MRLVESCWGYVGWDWVQSPQDGISFVEFRGEAVSHSCWSNPITWNSPDLYFLTYVITKVEFTWLPRVHAGHDNAPLFLADASPNDTIRRRWYGNTGSLEQQHPFRLTSRDTCHVTWQAANPSRYTTLTSIALFRSEAETHSWTMRGKRRVLCKYDSLLHHILRTLASGRFEGHSIAPKTTSASP